MYWGAIAHLFAAGGLCLPVPFSVLHIRVLGCMHQQPTCADALAIESLYMEISLCFQTVHKQDSNIRRNRPGGRNLYSQKQCSSTDSPSKRYQSISAGASCLEDRFVVNIPPAWAPQQSAEAWLPVTRFFPTCRHLPEHSYTQEAKNCTGPEAGDAPEWRPLRLSAPHDRGHDRSDLQLQV